MNDIQEIVKELEALSRSSEPLKDLIEKAKMIRRKLSGVVFPRGCKLNPAPSNYSPGVSKAHSIPRPYWVNVKSGQTLDLVTVGTPNSSVVASVKASKRHPDSSVITLVQRKS